MIRVSNAFLVFLLAVTITLSSLLTHGAGNAHAGLAASETANVHAISMCGSCETYSLSHPSPIRIDISHPALQVKSYRIYPAIETPPPRVS